MYPFNARNALRRLKTERVYVVIWDAYIQKSSSSVNTAPLGNINIIIIYAF